MSLLTMIFRYIHYLRDRPETNASLALVCMPDLEHYWATNYNIECRAPICIFHEKDAFMILDFDLKLRETPVITLYSILQHASKITYFIPI
jgi:hypothetical protein